MAEGRGISIIVPAFNEEQGLEKAVEQTLQTFSDMGLEHECIIVDDGSTDGTWAVAQSLDARFAQVRAVSNGDNKGIGYSFRRGIEGATQEFVVFVPVDNPLEPDDVEAYLGRMDVCDIVVGCRAERVGYSQFGLFASFVYNRIMVPLLFNLGISDVNWIQFYRRALFEDGTLAFESDRIFFLVEILVQARRKGLIIAEVPAKMRRRMYGKATCARFSTMAKTFFEMVRYFIKLQRGTES